MTSNSASHRASAATALRYSSRKQVRLSEILLRAANGIDSCHHRVIEVVPGNIDANRAAHSQHLVQVRVQAMFEDFLDPVVPQPLENLAREPFGFIRVGTQSRAADGAQSGLHFGQ